MDLESPIATETLVYRIKFLSPSCSKLEADSNLGKCHIGNLNPYTSWKLHEKISAHFRENEIRKFFAIFHYFQVIGIFHLRKSASLRCSVLAICAPNLSKIHWSPEVLWRFGIFGPTDHGQARWRRTDFSGRRPSGWLGSFQLFYL